MRMAAGRVLKLRDETQETQETQGQTERFLTLVEEIRFAHNNWRFSEWGNFPSVPSFPQFPPVSHGATVLCCYPS